VTKNKRFSLWIDTVFPFYRPSKANRLHQDLQIFHPLRSRRLSARQQRHRTTAAGRNPPRMRAGYKNGSCRGHRLCRNAHVIQARLRIAGRRSGALRLHWCSLVIADLATLRGCLATQRPHSMSRAKPSSSQPAITSVYSGSCSCGDGMPARWSGERVLLAMYAGTSGQVLAVMRETADALGEGMVRVFPFRSSRARRDRGELRLAAAVRRCEYSAAVTTLTRRGAAVRRCASRRHAQGNCRKEFSERARLQSTRITPVVLRVRWFLPP
jgi:hypothetical protein